MQQFSFANRETEIIFQLSCIFFWNCCLTVFWLEKSRRQASEASTMDSFVLTSTPGYYGVHLLAAVNLSLLQMFETTEQPLFSKGKYWSNNYSENNISVGNIVKPRFFRTFSFGLNVQAAETRLFLNLPRQYTFYLFLFYLIYLYHFINWYLCPLDNYLNDAN